MATVWLSRFSRWLEALNNAKGGPVVFDIEANAGMMWVPFSGVEDRYLQGWNRYANSFSVAAVAAQFGNIKMRNPTGSNVIAVLERLVWIAASDSPQLGFGASTTDLTAIVSNTFSRLDPRGNPQPTLILSDTATATVFTGPVFIVSANNTGGGNAEFIRYTDDQIPILPGQAVQVQSVVANQLVTASVMWRERALQQSELT